MNMNTMEQINKEIEVRPVYVRSWFRKSGYSQYGLFDWRRVEGYRYFIKGEECGFMDVVRYVNRRNQKRR